MTLCCVVGCGKKSHKDFHSLLPHDYSLVRSNAYTITIWSPDGYTGTECIIGPKIESMQIIGDIVTGMVIESPMSELPATTTPGFFILDTSSGNVVTGLAEKDWTSALASFGILSLPTLEKPDSFR